MRAFTLTEANEMARGLPLCPSTEGFGLLFQDTVLRAEKKVNNHLEECTAALLRRSEGDFTPSPLLGEQGRARVDPDTANDALLEVADGWPVDHLTVDREGGNVLMHIPDYPGEKRCLVLIAPSIDQGGELQFSSNLPMEEIVMPHGIERVYHPIDKAAGVERVYSDGRKTLLVLQRNASFRVRRVGCSEGWREVLVSWNGRVLRKKPVGPRRHRRAS